MPLLLQMGSHTKYGLTICGLLLIKVEHSLEKSLGTNGSMSGFKPKSRRSYRPQTKGKVEALERTVDHLKVYNGEFDTLDDMIDLVFELNEELNKDFSQAIDCSIYPKIQCTRKRAPIAF